MKHHPPDGATDRARQLRRRPTKAELAMWKLLRTSFPEARFRRQVPIRHYIVDFVSHPARIVIEVDGGQHQVEIDADRTRVIEYEGYRILRFWNDDVLGNSEGVWSVIDTELQRDHPHPASTGGLAPSKPRWCRRHHKPVDPIKGEVSGVLG